MGDASKLHPDIEPHARGLLEVPGGDRIYWEVCGNPAGKPAVVLHGGPGSGCQPWHRRLFDAGTYRVVMLDQRGCGRSVPHAGSPQTSLAANTTLNLIADLELLRANLGIERWLVLGGSWGSTLALAYAQHFPERVTELVLFGVTTGRKEEFDWLFRGGVSRFFPEQWARLKEGVPDSRGDGAVADAYATLLQHQDPAVREHAAHEWCLWESATLNWPPRVGLAARFRDPAYAMAFARIVTHYVRHNAWLDDARILSDVAKLEGIPGVLITGRFDFQAPISYARTLHRLWPGSRWVVVNDAGHASDDSGITLELISALERFSRGPELSRSPLSDSRDA